MRSFRSIVFALATTAFAAASVEAAGYRLAPYKDELFAYPATLSSKAGGDYVVVEYIDKRDLYGRDVVPEKKTKPDYVSLEPKEVEQDLTLRDGGATVQFIATGKIQGKAKAIVVYIHGRNGNRFQGANDWMFGGNFNRIKNLMVRNGGVYLSPGLPDLRAKGTSQVKALIREFSARSPNAPVFVACGSLGGRVCWALARDPEVAPKLSGLLLMGSVVDDGFLKTAAFRERLPIYLGHGTRDIVINWKNQDGFFKKVRAAAPDYPIKLAIFDTGSHGTPIRMTDWRLILNWMLQVDGK